MFDYAQDVIALNDIDDDTMNKFNDEIFKSFDLSLDWRHVPFYITDTNAKFPLIIILEIEIIKYPESLVYKLNDIKLHLPTLLTDFMNDYWKSLNKEEVINNYKNKLLNIIKTF